LFCKLRGEGLPNINTSAGTFWKAGLMMDMSSGRSSSVAISILVLEVMAVGGRLKLSAGQTLENRVSRRRLGIDSSRVTMLSRLAKRTPYS